MKFTIAFATTILLASTASATCYGSDAFKTCYDTQSGNSYTVNKLGNTTYMNGNNSNTGSSWSQESHTFGNTTQHYGRDSEGNNWNHTCFNGRC